MVYTTLAADESGTFAFPTVQSQRRACHIISAKTKSVDEYLQVVDGH